MHQKCRRSERRLRLFQDTFSFRKEAPREVAGGQQSLVEKVPNTLRAQGIGEALFLILKERNR